MTNEERDIITQFIARVGGAQAAQPSFGGSVPATTTQALPPVDPEADRFIADLFSRYPEARYRITQLAFVQEHALAEAQNRLQRMDWEVQQARQQAQQAPQQQQPSGSGGGFFSGLFGGGARPSGPPPQPQQGAPVWNQAPQQGYQQAPPPGYQQAPPPQQYAPSYQPGMFQRSGSGFLGSALTTAAGVAGGLVAGNALMSLFSGSRGEGGGGGGFGGGGGAAIRGVARRAETRATSIRAPGTIHRLLVRPATPAMSTTAPGTHLAAAPRRHCLTTPAIRAGTPAAAVPPTTPVGTPVARTTPIPDAAMA